MRDASTPDSEAPRAGYPNSTNTGIPPGTTLTRKSSSSCNWMITADGTVVDSVDLDGCIDIEANDVTIKNSHLRSNTWWGIKYGATKPNITGLKVLHNKIDTVPGQGPDNGGYDYGISQQTSGAGTMEVAFNDISGFKDGVDVSAGSIHDNYFHDLSSFQGAHTQDIYVYAGGGPIAIRHNTVINQTGKAYATAAIYIAPDSGHQNDVEVNDNWLAGGSLTVYGGDSTATHIRFTRNQFSTALWPNGGFNGPVGYWFPRNAGNVWSGNVWADGPKAGQTLEP
ncbi:hypothetical protein [Pendulispora albinea]|uniref:Right handed beta helix domain-containing protein n=1 Tax=Pendulispora albinea TaxID=2741071 RepID=A0ABZ2MC57_9BACT